VCCEPVHASTIFKNYIMRSVDDMVWPISTCGRNRLCLWPISSVADIVVPHYIILLFFVFSSKDPEG